MTERPVPEAIRALAEADDLKACATAKKALERIINLYEESLARIGEDFDRYAKGEVPARRDDTTYPFLAVEAGPGRTHEANTLSFGKISSPGVYGTTIAAPKMFRTYLLEQMEMLVQNNDARLYVGRSKSPVPLTFALEKQRLPLLSSNEETYSSPFICPT